MTKLKVKDTDKGMKALLKQLGARMPMSAVGIIGDGGMRDGDEPTNQQVGTWHEFGAGKIPKRSFIRDTFDINRNNFNTRLQKIAGQILANESNGRKEMARFGLYAEGVIKKRIAAGIPPALADVTIKRKGSSKPLIHTGQLRNSIASEVR